MNNFVQNWLQKQKDVDIDLKKLLVKQLNPSKHAHALGGEVVLIPPTFSRFPKRGVQPLVMNDDHDDDDADHDIV